MSDWGHSLGEGRVKILLIATSRVQSAVTLAYARAVLIVRGSTCAPITFLLVNLYQQHWTCTIKIEVSKSISVSENVNLQLYHSFRKSNMSARLQYTTMNSE